MSNYAEELVRQWELDDPRDSWRHTGEPPPSARSTQLPGWKPIEEQARDIDRMLFCDVCGSHACFGFGVTLESVRMGDVGAWHCEEHHPARKARYTREEWARARSAGLLYPDDEIQPEENAA